MTTAAPTADILSAPESTPAATPKKTSRALIVLPTLIAIALGTGGVAYAVGHGKETTDDAQVEGHVANVSPRVSGQVRSVLVKDNQVVKVGDVLVELDD